MARPFRQPENEGEEEVGVEGGQPQSGRRPREPRDVPPSEDSDEYDSPDEDTGQHYERLLMCIYNVLTLVLHPPHHHRRRNSERGRRQQGEWDPTEQRARPRRRSRVSSALAAEAARAHDSDVEGDGLWEMAVEARRMAGRRRLSSRTVATETDEEPPRGASSNCQLAGSSAEAAGARRSMSTSSTQCSYEDWAEEAVDGGPEGDEEEEEEDEVFVTSRAGDAHPPPRPPSPPPPSSNLSGPGDPRSSGGGSLQSRKQRRRKNGGGSSGGSGRQRQCLLSATAPADDDPKMAAARMADQMQRSMEEWDAVSRELKSLRWKRTSQFKQADKRKKTPPERGGAISALLSPILPSVMPGVWTLVAVCVGARVIGRLW